MGMSEVHHADYDDTHSTCAETYSTLRIFSENTTPEEISSVLQMEPTKSFRMGDRHAQGRLQRKTHGWFYCTKALSTSKDTRRHIDLILATLEGKTDALRRLHSRGCRTDITSYWVSSGQGGPWLMPEQMRRLGELNIDVWWDVYFAGDDKTGA